jgi:putative signal transducing protein
MEFVELVTFESEQAADLAASRLRAAGIPSSVAKADGGGMYPQFQLLGGVRLLVPPDRLQDARRVLKVSKR